jgi:hypothetical protein
VIDFYIKTGIRIHVPSVLAVPIPVFNRDPISRGKSQIDFTGKTGIRLCKENRILIFPEQFAIAIVIMIACSDSEPGCEMMRFKIITHRYNSSAEDILF